MSFIKNMLVTWAIILWLLVNYFTGGFPFSSILCVFAGIFMIMPSLLDFEIKDFLKIGKWKKLLRINLLANILITPLIARGIGSLFFQDIWLTITLTMLALLSWGGLVFAWIKKTGGNNSLWFQLFMLNLLIFTVIFFLATPWVQQIGMMQTAGLSCGLSGPVSCGVGWNISPISALVVLVIFPFLVSRIILWNKKMTAWAKQYSKYLSQIGTFIIIGYIFSLQQVHTLFETNIILVIKIFVATLLFYLLVFAYNLLIYHRILSKTSESKSLFWLATSRFITLGLVLSFMYTQYFGADIMLIFVSAYFIQIGFSQWVSRYLK